MLGSFNLGRFVRSRKTLKPIEPSAAGERAYLVALRQLVRIAYRAARLTTSAPLMTMAVNYSPLSRRVASALGIAVPEAVEAVKLILQAESAAHTRKWREATSRIAGIDLSRVITESDLTEEFDLIVARNVSLIRDLGSDIQKRVEQAVTTASLEGQGAKQLATTLREQFGIIGRRADIIARDQIGSAVTDLSRLRQIQAGIKKYEWSSAEDKRVRPAHAELDGKEFLWSDPGPDNGNYPGQAILCRCAANAIVEPIE
jgi:SPP1 gp7 family putative phage head morphogenesis protein